MAAPRLDSFAGPFCGLSRNQSLVQAGDPGATPERGCAFFDLRKIRCAYGSSRRSRSVQASVAERSVALRGSWPLACSRTACRAGNSQPGLYPCSALAQLGGSQRAYLCARSWRLAQPVPVIRLRFPRSPLGSLARLLRVEKTGPTAARHSRQLRTSSPTTPGLAECADR